jgi:hypothetical protein
MNMEIIGRNIPQLQSAISSGLDNVTSGITESVKASGISALEDTFQVFSTSNMGTATDTYLLPAVANVAEYSDPITSLSKQSTGSSETAAPSLPLLQTMQNPKFAPEAELSAFTEEKVNDTFKNLAKKLPDHDIIEYPDKIGNLKIDAKNISAAGDNLLIMPNKAESESAQARSILKNNSLLRLDSNSKKQKELEDQMKEMEAQQWKKLKESLGQVDQLPYVTTDVGTAATKDAKGSGVSQIAEPPTTGSETASASASLEARGIIIVGGKTDGTYFQTIDDSIKDLQNDPQPKTIELIQNQVKAVQDMTSTSMKAVQLYQQFNSRVSIR